MIVDGYMIVYCGEIVKKLFSITILICALFGLFCGCHTIASPFGHHHKLFSGGGEFGHPTPFHHENAHKKWSHGHKPKFHHRHHKDFAPKFKGTDIRHIYKGPKGKHFKRRGDFRKHGDRRFKKPNRDKRYPGRMGYKKTFTNFKD
jgi:hypothetical protein